MQVRSSEPGPIYIGGLDRCGKTTLRAFLASHPNISIPAVGSNLWTYFYNQYGNLRQSDNFEKCLDAMLHYKHALFLKPDPERIRREFWQGEPTYSRLFALIHMHHAEREGKPRWGAQTGLIERYAVQVFEAFPNARMIYMLRDPRDRYEASLAMWPTGKGRVGAATARWMYSTSHAERNLRKYPDRFMVVRFEDMVRRPEETLRGICDFIGEEYTPRMLAMESEPQHKAKLLRNLGGSVNSMPLSEEFIGRNREKLPKREIAFMQTIAGRRMEGLGYSLDPIQLTWEDSIRYSFIDFPLNLFRMFAWLFIEYIQHNLPGVFGRKPSSKMIIKQPELHFRDAGAKDTWK